MFTMPSPKLPTKLARFLVACLFAAGSSGAQATFEIPRPSGWIADRTGRVPAESLEAFRHTAEKVRRETGGELAAVVLDSLGGREPRAVAQGLFDAWHLGGREEKEGLLILVSLTDRHVELMLGQGLDDPQRRKASDEILHQVLVPHLHSGDLAGALTLAARESSTRIFHTVNLVEEPAKAPEEAPRREFVPPFRDPAVRWVPYVLGLALLLLAVAIIGWWRSESRRG